MATLHARNIPDKLYRHIQKLADEENRSLTTEVVWLLNQGIRVQQARTTSAATLGRLRQRIQKARLSPDWVDSSNLIREDRQR